MRAAGHAGFHIRLVYGNYMALVELSCLVSCLRKNNACKGTLDPELYYFFLGLWTTVKGWVEYLEFDMPDQDDTNELSQDVIDFMFHQGTYSNGP